MINLYLFKKVTLNGLKYFFYFICLFFINRFIFFSVYGKWSQLGEYLSDIFYAFFIVGPRFDISAICYAFLPLAVFWLFSLFIPKRFTTNFQKIYLYFSCFYLLFVLVVYVSLFIIDFFYYQFFQSHINILFFGIFNDDTKAVLKSVWTDYPVFKIFIIYTLCIISFLFLHKKIKKNFSVNTYPASKKTLFLLAVFPLFIAGMRGSLGEFTLRREHTNIGTNEFINTLCYNPVYALKFAKSELNDNLITPDIAQELKMSGFSSFEQVKEVYRENIIDDFDKNLYSTTAHNEFLEKNPPNIVFILMESMSNHYFELHSKELNLLGDLNEILPELYYFKNGLSSFNGTIYSLENLMVNTPKGIISQSPYFDTSFSSSVSKPFKEQGYETYFITGAHLSWRNTDKFIKKQGFDIIKGSSHIKQKFPNAEDFAWGTHDGYLFDYIKDQLQQSPSKPKMIFSLTVSNHTPYEIPTHYKPYPIKIDAIKNLLRVDEKMAYANFYSHQYSASQLAKFIKDIKNSPLGENTIIVATGDHNIRQVFEYDDENSFLKRSVPILFYIPEKYKPAFFDSSVMASHKDIFPTIFNLSLSNQKYIYSGDNLFKKSPNYRFAINEYNFIADSIGVISYENGSPAYYTWKDKNKRKLSLDNIQNPHAQFMLNKMKAFSALQTIQIYMDIEKSK